MGILSSRNKITCPLCKKELDVKKAKEEGELEIQGKDEKGYIHMKHVSFCGTNIVWDTFWNKVYEKDLRNIK